MGNTPSRTHSRKKKSCSSDELAQFTRTDTSQSIKSSKSVRSTKSRRSQAGSIPDATKTGASDSTTASIPGSSNSRKNSNSHLNSVAPVISRSNSQHSFTPQQHTNESPQDQRLSAEQQRTPRGNCFNSGELPPSMVQMQPKSPILRYFSSNSNLNTSYNENSLTDDDMNTNYNDSNGAEDAISNRSRRESRRRSSTSSQHRRSGGQQHTEIPSFTTTPSCTSSHSSLHSRKSSFNGGIVSAGGNSVYSTPLTSPAVRREDPVGYFSNNDVPYDSIKETVNTEAEREQTYKAGVKSERRDSSPDAPQECEEILIEGQDGVLQKNKKQLKPLDVDEMIQKLLDAGYLGKRTRNVCLKNSEIAQICHQAREIFLSQPSLLELSTPVKIVGDVHGQYADLLRLFTKCGFPPSSNYLFLGDYVDRGKQSLETILLLLCYKIKYPENFFLLRGNHECANVTRVYGFYDECKRRCNIKTWKLFIDTFNTLPLAAIVAGKIFCVHGGLSPVLNSMDEVRHVSRPTDVPDFGLINDLLWSDPTDSPNEWEDNERGVSYCYNKVAINKFLNKFGFDLVCRAHMVVEDGYEFFNDRSLVTVFSAPNYCGEFDNWGAVMSVSEGLICSFELLDPLDSGALKQVMKKGRQERKLANRQQLQQQNMDLQEVEHEFNDTN